VTPTFDNVYTYIIQATTAYIANSHGTYTYNSSRFMQFDNVIFCTCAELTTIAAKLIPLAQITGRVDIRIQLHKVLPRRDCTFDGVFIHSGRALRQLRFRAVGVGGRRRRVIVAARAASRFRGSATVLSRFG